jgi:arylsulfatase A-like enzyme
MIVIDTLRYDYVRANGNEAIQTPNLDRLVAKSWNFHRAFTGSFPTIPNRTDLITARYGAPFHRWKPLDCDKVTVPQALAELGYCTQLIHDTPHLVNGGHSFDYPFHAWTPVRGAEVDRAWITDSWEAMENWSFDPLFDCYPKDPKDILRKINSMGGYVHTNRDRRREEDWNVARLFSTASRFLRDNARRSNFFLWIDCFDPHEPWDAPPAFVKRYDKTPGFDGRIDLRAMDSRWTGSPAFPRQCWDRLAAYYSAKVTFMDKWLGVFLDTLEEAGLAERTAIVLTADHGTNLKGDRPGRPFHKTSPPRMHEARVPLIVHVPGGGSGRSDVITQPQDLFATILSLAGGRAPAGTESNDVLHPARKPAAAPREIALCGTAVGSWKRWGKSKVLFSVLDNEWCLGFTADPANCELQGLGSLDNVAADKPAVVERLWKSGIDELARRGLDPVLVAWLRSEGSEPFPKDFRETDAHPAPPAWRSYFGRLYHGV